MPRMSRSEYERMKTGSQSMQDTLSEMLAAGTTVEAPEMEERPAKPTLLGFGREVMGRVLGGSQARAANPDSMAGRVGANMRRTRDLNAALSKEGDNEESISRALYPDRWKEGAPEVDVVAQHKAQGEADLAEVQKRIKKRKEEEEE